MKKTKKQKYRSPIAAIVHEGIRDLYQLGIVDQKTMRDFDLRCLTTLEDLTGKDIKRLRKREGISQAVLANCLNVTTNYVSQMERGTKQPRGATLKLLCLIKRKGVEAVF